MDSDTIKTWIIFLVPFIYAALEAAKKAGLPKEWAPVVNALLALFAGGGVALLEKQDLPAAVVQVVVLFLMTAGTHDRVQKLIKKYLGKPVEEKEPPAYYTQGSEQE